ncbi:MAG: prephenate dehydrogenase/arogenate dehydrogenase family protein [Spirochaetota bacterium]
MVKKVSILGMSFSGVSLGLSLKQNQKEITVTGIDKASEVVRAKNLGAIDNGCLDSSIGEGLSEADVVFLATPIQTTKELIPQVPNLVKDSAIVTDICITKSEIVGLASQYFNEKPCFIGGHPIVGFRQGTIEQADPYLFINNTYVLTPLKKQKSGSIGTLKSLIENIGARVVVMDPREHDYLVGGVNHILQLIAIAHINTMIGEMEDKKIETALLLAGERFKQFTQALLSSSHFWEDILMSNYENVKNSIKKFISRLNLLIDGLGEEMFHQEYEKARKIVRKIPTQRKGFSTTLFNLYVDIKDEPGAIARVASLIASKGYDVKDIALVRIKEGEAATLRLAFENQNVASRVGRLLMKNRYAYRTQYNYEDYPI